MSQLVTNSRPDSVILQRRFEQSAHGTITITSRAYLQEEASGEAGHHQTLPRWTLAKLRHKVADQPCARLRPPKPSTDPRHCCRTTGDRGRQGGPASRPCARSHTQNNIKARIESRHNRAFLCDNHKWFIGRCPTVDIVISNHRSYE